jgi:lipid II:glycine glycyltransferase (peptidoglycan interpeptide bridge formation enzyme)
MAINSPLTGQRGVALPFTDQCPVIDSDGNHFQELFGKIIAYGKKAEWNTIEIRGGKEYLQGKIPSATYLAHSLDLAHPEQKIFSTFRSSTKRNINKAIKENVRVKILNSLESVKEFYQLNCMTRKKHGLPPQPFYFFRKLYKHIISKKKGFVILASYCDKVVAGAIYSHFGNKALFKYGASDKNYQHLRANNLVMWEAIKWYEQNGCKYFSFGRTEPDHEGLLQFKRGWGTQEETIHYYKYDLTKDEFVKDSSRIKSFYSICQKLPLPVLKLAGHLVYRHIG